jgi:transcriptional regulator with XRE-family HTH domain
MPSRATDADKFIGYRIKRLRKLAGYSQSRLAEEVGITYQQIQKYERGTNRIAAARLIDIARILEIPVQFFLTDLPRGYTARRDMSVDKTELHTLALIRAYHSISDPKAKEALIKLAQQMAAG